jgi:endonuclease III
VPFRDLRGLREFYGLLPRPPTDLFQFFLWEILSADTLPARRDMAWQALRRVPALTPDSVFRAPPEKLQYVIGLLGAHRDERIDSVRATVSEFKRHRDRLSTEAFAGAGLLGAARALRPLSHLPYDMRERALLYAGGYQVLPLDQPAARVVARLEGTTASVREAANATVLKRLMRGSELRMERRRARKALGVVLPRDVSAYQEAVLYLRHHGEHTCVAVGPHCGICPLATGCAFAHRAQRGPA